MRRGGERLRERMAESRLHLEDVTAAGRRAARGTRTRRSRPGGKRLRPLLVLLAAEAAGGPPASADGESCLVRAAVAVELVHSATLVHDDVIDGASCGGDAHGALPRRAAAPRSPPATCCSRARLPSSHATAIRPSCSALSDACSALAAASCCSARTPMPSMSRSSAT